MSSWTGSAEKEKKALVAVSWNNIRAGSEMTLFGPGLEVKNDKTKTGNIIRGAVP